MWLWTERYLVPISMVPSERCGRVTIASLSSVSIFALPWACRPGIVGVVVSPGVVRKTCPLELVSELLLVGLLKMCRRPEEMHLKENLPERERTKIPDPPIHFSGTTNFFDPKNEFTNHQFENSVLDPPLYSGPLSNYQTVVKSRDSWLNFYEGPIAICKRFGEKESRRGDKKERCQSREHLSIGGKGSTRLCYTYSPITR